MHDLLAILMVVGIPVLFGITVYWVARLGIADHRRSRRADRDHRSIPCATCGYDLRASADRCPECGAQIPTRADRYRSRDLQLDPDMLQTDWPASAVTPRSPAPDEKPVVVHSSRQWAEGELLVQQLRARGVSAELQKGEGMLLPGMGPPNWAVNVPSGDAVTARSIVDRVRLLPPADESRPATEDVG